MSPNRGASRAVRALLVTAIALLALATAARRAFLHGEYLPFPEDALAPRESRVVVDGIARTYAWAGPASRGGAPLVLALHGAFADGRTMRRQLGPTFERVALEDGAVVVYPDAWRGQWNDCRAAGSLASRARGVDDVAFLRALVRRFATSHRIDTTRVYVVGFSNGAHMGFRLALEAPALIGGLAAIGAQLPASGNLACRPSPPRAIPVMLVNGTADPISPVNGGEVSVRGFAKRGRVRSALETAHWFAEAAGLGAEHASRRLPDLDGDGSWVEERTWSLLGRPSVTLLLVHGAGHTLPARDATFPSLLGRTNHDVDAATLIWRFFQDQAHVARAP